MGSAVDVQSPGAERRVFWTAAAATVVLDLITKIVAEATLLRTPGISVVGVSLKDMTRKPPPAPKLTQEQSIALIRGMMASRAADENPR